MAKAVNDHNAHKGADASRHQQHARGKYRITEKALQKPWQQCQAGKKHDTIDENKNSPYGKIAVEKAVEANIGRLAAANIGEKHGGENRRQRTFENDFPGVEPALTFAPVEHQLQCGYGEA